MQDWGIGLNKQDVKWVYSSPIGEIEVWAKDKAEVISTLRTHGFFRVDETKISQVNVNVEHEEVR